MKSNFHVTVQQYSRYLDAVYDVQLLRVTQHHGRHAAARTAEHFRFRPAAAPPSGPGGGSEQARAPTHVTLREGAGSAPAHRPTSAGGKWRESLQLCVPYGPVGPAFVLLAEVKAPGGRPGGTGVRSRGSLGAQTARKCGVLPQGDILVGRALLAPCWWCGNVIKGSGLTLHCNSGLLYFVSFH